MKIGIIIGSVRESRAGEAVGQWVLDAAKKREGADYELVDLRSFNVPLLTSATVPMAANGQYDSAEVQAWSAAIDSYDGFVFVTAEYNHGIPGAFKNAIDSLGMEWFGKTVAFVSYGADSGVRAVEQWRAVLANFDMVDIRPQVSLSLFTDFAEDGLAPLDRRPQELDGMLDKLESITRTVRG